MSFDPLYSIDFRIFLQYFLIVEKKILHIDFDSFFASVEQQYNPRLRGKPIGVTATNGRTCIIASSREAKRFGVKTGSRSYEAYQICPALILVPADFIKYWEISQKFVRICKDYSPYLEVFSIDELFMDVTTTFHLFGNVSEIIKAIKFRILKEIGEYITVSIGISYNKLLAKLASGMNKPNGITEITKENMVSIYTSAKLTDVCGIGERIKERLQGIGVNTLLELREIQLSLLIKEFGNAEGIFLKKIGLGIDDNPIIPYTTIPTVKSIGRNYCLPQNEYSRRIVLQNIYELCEEVGIKLRRLMKKAKTIGVYLRGNVNLHGQKTYSDYFDNGSEIFRSCNFLINKSFMQSSADYIRQIGIWVSNLEDTQNLPLSLFDYNAKKDGLQRVIDNINERFGDHTIRRGFLLYADKLTTVPNGYMADKYERIKLANSSFQIQ